MELDRLRRVREPASRSKSGVQGKVADVVHGRSRHAESQNELRAFQVLMATAHADSWQEQRFVLEYHHEEASTDIRQIFWFPGVRDARSRKSRTTERPNYRRIKAASLSSANYSPSMAIASAFAGNLKFMPSHASQTPISYCGIAPLWFPLIALRHAVKNLPRP